jgi:hypothetical protein
VAGAPPAGLGATQGGEPTGVGAKDENESTPARVPNSSGSTTDDDNNKQEGSSDQSNANLRIAYSAAKVKKKLTEDKKNFSKHKSEKELTSGNNESESDEHRSVNGRRRLNYGSHSQSYIWL